MWHVSPSLDKEKNIRMNNEKPIYDLQIYRWDMRGKIINIDDTFNYTPANNSGHPEFFDKVKLAYTHYFQDKDGNSTGQPSQRFQHYVDVAVMLTLSKMMAMGRKTDMSGGKHTDGTPRPFMYEEFKGSPSKDYETGYESRVLRIEFKSGEGMTSKQLQDGFYDIRFTKGPGKPSKTGAVEPAGDKSTQVSDNISIPVQSAMIGMETVNAYLHSKATMLLMQANKTVFGGR